MTGTTTSDQIDVDAIRAAIGGDLFTPSDATWDAERAAWNLAVDQRPALVALPNDAADVAVLVKAARDAGVEIAPQSTGHNAAPLGDLGGTMLLRTSRLRDVELDPETRIARVGGGAVWGDVAPLAAEHGLMPLQGSSHDVGIAGYTLGGGMSFLARKHGLSCERLRAVEIVTGDGELRRVDRENEPDLFWALRGGGGGFGVVTALEFELLPIGEILAGALFFPPERSAEVLRAWRDWTEKLPEELTSVASLRHFPPFPDVPEPIRGKSFVVVEVYGCGDPAEGERLIEPMRALEPVMDNVAMADSAGLLPIHMDPPEPVPGIGDHLMLSGFDDAAIDRVVPVVDHAEDAPLAMFEVRMLGGALARRDEGAGALGCLDDPYAVFSVCMLPVPELENPVRAKLASIRGALEPLDTGSAYLNFAEATTAPESLFRAEDLARLRSIRERYAGGMFRANHPIGA